MQIEAIHFQHFNDIKKLCKGEQIQAFNALTADLAMYFSKKPNKPKNN
jgi:periplasmic protein CpxP/Spy